MSNEEINKLLNELYVLHKNEGLNRVVSYAVLFIWIIILATILGIVVSKVVLSFF